MTDGGTWIPCLPTGRPPALASLKLWRSGREWQKNVGIKKCRTIFKANFI